ncbi:MAG TPA: adenylate/guanylate cyclase domain-containing protein [Anaerolineales bacterium]|nr:adenylate/guanylate cyclase domain-containing protein [Anaerolineales bacterium]
MKISNKKQFNLSLALLAGTAIILLAVQMAGFSPNITTPLELAEYSARDSFMRLRGAEQPSNEIVIVAIDDASFGWTQFQWPWPRSYFAEIVDQINEGGGKVVGVDILLFEQDQEAGNDEAFSRALAQMPHAVSTAQIYQNTVDGFSFPTLQQPLPIYLEALDGVGTTSVFRDEDAIVRQVQAFDTFSEQVYYHWAFELARIQLGIQPPTEVSNHSITFNGQKVPLYQGRLLINFAGPAGTYPTYSAYDVHDGITLERNPDAFRGKIVLIGATTITLQDIYPTPFSASSPTSGVEIVANTVDTILNGKYLALTPPWMELLITLGIAVLAFFISKSKRPIFTLLYLIAGMVAWFGVTFVFFVSRRTFLPLITPQIMLFLGVVLPTLEQAVSQELEKRRVRNIFSRFISPEMVDHLIATRDMTSLNRRANLTILFSDIRGFTTLSEKLTPEEVVALLNPYLEAMSKVIHDHGGTVDKYEGDAIVAFFGEPVPYEDHAARALRAALDMRKALKLLREQWAREGSPSEIEMGIGINSGDVFVGLLGSEQRINYTVIGDNANLASRLQDLTKTYAWPVLISESTNKQVMDEFDTEYVDAVTVKGKSQPVNVYKVIGHKDARESEKLQGWKN